MSVIGSNILAGASGSQGYQISRSVRLRSSASAYFNRTPASAGSLTTWTWSSWVKRGQIGTFQDLFHAYPGSGQRSQILFRDTDTLYIELEAANTNNLTTTQVFRDVSAWYHIVVVYDSSNATSTDRVRLYVNGSRVTAFGTATYPSSGSQSVINSTTQHEISSYDGAGYYFDGYLTEVNFIDGQALTPASFGETNPVTGVWQPKKYTGTYGTNGFYLNFSDNSAATAAAIGKDNSGNGNNWTPNNISVTAGVTYDSMLDVPTQWADGGNGRGNYCVLNPLKNTASISNANLQTVNAASAGYYTSYATASMDSGKYYWEIVATDDGVNARYSGFGIADPSIALTSIGTAIANTQAVNSRGWLQAIRSSISVYTTGLYNNGAAVNTTTRATTSGTRIFMVAYDADTGKCWMGYEGTWWTGDPAAGTSQYFTATAPMMPVFNPYNDGSNATLIGSVNFGQRPFAYTPPTGFKALNTLNLPTPTILKGNQYFDIKLFTGNFPTGQTVGGLAFAPDLAWFKSRSVAASSHNLIDSARGAFRLRSNNTDAESSATVTLTSDGFTVGSQSESNDGSMVTWAWKEGATQGFDIVTYTGDGTNNRTVSHSLGVTPSMVIVKSRTSGTRSWFVAHRSLATNNNLLLQTTDIAYGPSAFGSGVVGNLTSSVFECVPGTIAPNNTANINANGENFIAYLFAAVAGYSAFGGYTGNGSTNGAFIYCGFRPRYVLVKQTDAVGNWIVWDTARSTFNQMQDYLSPNNSSAELNNVLVSIDALSNGFKCRTADDDINGNGNTYIYAAFAENPFKNALAR